MTLRASTGLRNAMLVTGSLKSQLDTGFIKIYGGAVPVDADAAIATATLLSTISVASTGTGLSIDTVATNGAVSKANEIWSGVNATGGVATFWRFVKSADTGNLSTTEVRLQGLAATSGTELVMTSTTLVGGATQNIDYFSVALPA